MLLTENSLKAPSKNLLKMQYDCYHMSPMGEDVIAELRDNLSPIGHIQFADHLGRHEPGSGKIDYQRIFSLLHGANYTGWCGAEYRPTKTTENTLPWLRSWQV